jgi:hypothetical protein
LRTPAGPARSTRRKFLEGEGEGVGAFRVRRAYAVEQKRLTTDEFKPDPIIGCVSQVLPAAEVALGRLDAGMAEQHLDLLQLASAPPAPRQSFAHVRR